MIPAYCTCPTPATARPSTNSGGGRMSAPLINGGTRRAIPPYAIRRIYDASSVEYVEVLATCPRMPPFRRESAANGTNDLPSMRYPRKSQHLHSGQLPNRAYIVAIPYSPWSSFYSMWRITARRRNICSRCGAQMIPLDSPVGVWLVVQYAGDGK